jgi:4-hydroxy-L-threonine phosphate dehydrogenase PdxA
MMGNTRPIIAITMGDASRAGSEVIVKALSSQRIYDMCRPLVVGEGTVISNMVRFLDSPPNTSKLLSLPSYPSLRRPPARKYW